VKTSVERVDDTTVKLSITVEAERVDAAIAEAARELASQVRIPGFRPGRAPRRVLESRLGKGALLDEAVRDSLPQFYSEAVESEDLPVVGAPSFDVETFTDGQAAEFTATVEVRPDFQVPDYRGLQVAHPDWKVTDEEVNAQLDALRERFAEVETITRPARVGDLVTVTVNAERNGQRVDEASVEDALHEIADPDDGGTELDRQVAGASAGAILRFHETLGEDAGELAGATLNYTAIVKQVQQKVLPALDDDFAITASEFDTLDELRADVRATLDRQKRAHARQALRGKVVEAVTELVDVSLPPSMVDAEQRFRLQRLAQQAEAYGLTADQYLAAAGGEGFLKDLESDARTTVKAQLVVDRLGRDLEIEVGQEDLGEEIARQATRLGRPPEELARFMTSSTERLSALISDAYRSKTIDAIVDAVQVLGGPPAEDEPPAEPGDEAE
jgi:trigger factor